MTDPDPKEIPSSIVGAHPPKPGACIIGEWNGETHEVLVVEDGFQWRAQTWASLSALAREMKGTHWSGARFFDLKPGRTDG